MKNKPLHYVKSRNSGSINGDSIGKVEYAGQAGGSILPSESDINKTERSDILSTLSLDNHFVYSKSTYKHLPANNSIKGNVGKEKQINFLKKRKRRIKRMVISTFFAGLIGFHHSGYFIKKGPSQ